MPEHALARSFEIIGDDDDRYRPGFPEAAAAMIVPTTVDVGLDLGAGTGKFTELLVDRARRTVAVEPSERMLQGLRVKLPDVEAQIGAAERIPLGDASVDVVTVAQAFHWFDRDAACDEIARVLVPPRGARAALESLRSDVHLGPGLSPHRSSGGVRGRRDDRRYG